MDFFFPVVGLTRIIGAANNPIVDETSFSVVYYLVIISLIVFLAWLFTKKFGNKLTGTRHGKLIKYVESTSLGLDKRVFIIDVQGVNYIIYTDKNNTVLLDRRDDMVYEDIKQPALKEYEALAPNTEQFKNILDNILRKKKGN